MHVCLPEGHGIILLSVRIYACVCVCEKGMDNS